MSTKYYIKKGDTAEELRVVMKKRQTPVNGVTPPDTLWLTSQSIENVFFSMAKIPQTLDNGDVLYPDGTIHKTDGTILNPPTNTDVYISNIHLLPGDILQEDYSVLHPDLSITYPNGLIYYPEIPEGPLTPRIPGYPNAPATLIPPSSLLLPNGMIQLPPNPSYPQGFILNPGSIDRTNYYKVGNPTDTAPNPDGTINLPEGCYLSSDNTLYLPRPTFPLPPGTTILSTTTVRFPSGTTQEESTTIDRTNALILPKWEQIHQSIYSLTYNSTTKRYTFPSGSDLVHYPLTQTAKVFFPNFSTIDVPYSSIKVTPNEYVFPYGTEYINAERKFLFPGQTVTLPLSATINNLYPYISVTFPPDTYIDTLTYEVTLIESPTLSTLGDVLLPDSSTIKLNSNHIVLYNLYEFYPRGTQRNQYGTIIHPEGYTPEAPSYIRYYPTTSHPQGLLIRPTDAAIVNNDGTFTKLDNSIVDMNGNQIQPPSTPVSYYTATSTPPFIPTSTQSSFVVINRATGSYTTILYNTTQSATLLQYQWAPTDTQHEGLYSGEFTIHYTNDTERTFPTLKDDILYIEILSHFNY